ncbi:MAG: hypothetical protein ABIQ95_08695 [Bdellovibrionia bacterium]
MVVEDLQAKAAEMMKKVLTVGVGALFLTEESLRALVSDFKLPKELLSAILESANKMKGDFLKNLSSDLMSQLMSHVDVAKLVEEIVAKNEIELKINVNFKPKKADKPPSATSR